MQIFPCFICNLLCLPNYVTSLNWRNPVYAPCACALCKKYHVIAKYYAHAQIFRLASGVPQLFNRQFRSSCVSSADQTIASIHSISSSLFDLFLDTYLLPYALLPATQPSCPILQLTVMTIYLLVRLRVCNAPNLYPPPRIYSVNHISNSYHRCHHPWISCS